VSLNWEKWQRDKPQWFTNELIKSIPLSVLSEDMRAELFLLVFRTRQDSFFRHKKLTEAEETKRDSLEQTAKLYSASKALSLTAKFLGRRIEKNRKVGVDDCRETDGNDESKNNDSRGKSSEKNASLVEKYFGKQPMDQKE
jgi:hypothetical protein